MSYDVDLTIDSKLVEVERHEEGGTYVVGGTSDASLNVTYNYSRLFCLALHEKGLRALDGMFAGDSIEMLEKAVEKLGTTRYSDYWAATPGNAGHALNILLGWARQHPQAIWHVS